MTLIDEQGAKLIACDVVFTLASLVAVALRLVAIRIRKRAYRVHDWMIIIAVIVSVGIAIDQIVGVVRGGIGLHVTQVSLPEIAISLKALVAATFLWITATCAIKFSVLFLYLDIFDQKWFKWCCYVFAIIVSLFFISFILTGALVCRPFAANWDKTIPGAVCGSSSAEQIAAASTNMGLDIILVIMPMPVLWNLQMPLKKKLIISGILSLGICICAINLARIVLTLQANQLDYTYTLVNASLFSSLEVWIGIITTCLPTLGPIINPKAFTQASAYRASASHHGKPNAPALSPYDSVSGLRDDKNTFQQLDDGEYDLHDFIKSNDGGARAHAAVSSRHGPTSTTGIEVRRDVEVFSSPK